MSRSQLVLRYVTFAVMATLANLAVQRLVLAAEVIPAMFAYTAALLAGTAAGLVTKFVLDKRWIFHDASTGAAQGKLFSLYALTGIATTAIFWGSETLFWLAWQTEAARELGAVLGLSAGYVIKYRLDRRFVFAPAQDLRP
ncbi:MAG: GtrA family protein [Erythrobacter sp.]